ncbi:MAG: methyltransferase domain-containing protein [Chitinophagales bacterium]
MDLHQAISLIDHDALSKKTISAWADLGCGSGLFTNALCGLLGHGCIVYAIDKNLNVLNTITSPTSVQIKKIKADFILDELPVPTLNGILMANSLHYVKDKKALLAKLQQYLKKDAVFLIVEYDTTVSNQWVPFPINFQALGTLFSASGYHAIQKIKEQPSIYNRANIYSAIISR